MLPRPSKDDIDKKISQFSDLFSGWQAAAQNYNSLYRLNFHVPKHEDWDEYLTGSAKRIVDDAVDNIALEFPHIEFYNPEGTAKGEERSESLELICRSVWQQSDTEAPIPVKRALANDLFRVGMACAKSLLDYSRWPQKPKTKSEQDLYETTRALVSPIIVRRVNPTTILFDPTEDTSNPPWIIEKYKRTGAAIKSRFPKTDLKNIEDDEEVVWLEYWDKEWRAFYANDVEVATIRHNWGFAPYCIGFSGYGVDIGGNYDNVSLAGIIAERAVPMLYGVQHLLEAESETLTQIITLGANIAYNSPYIKTNDPIGALQRAKFAPGKTAILGMSDEVNWPPVQPGLAQLYQNLQEIRTLIEEATYPSSVMGRRQPGTSSGYDRALIVGTARLKFGAPLAALNHIGTTSCAMIARLFETMTEPLSIYGVGKDGSPQFKSIKPGIVKHFYFCKFELKQNAPEDEDRKQLTGMTLLNSGKFDEFPILEKYFGITNPRENLVNRMAQQIVQAALPGIVQRFVALISPQTAVQNPNAPQAAAGPLSERAPGTSAGQTLASASGEQAATAARSLVQRLTPQPQPRMGRPGV